MIHEVIHLNEHYPLSEDPILEITTIEIRDTARREKSPAVLIAPGGGYDFISKREGDPIAVAFIARGYIACVLNYSTDPKRHRIHYPTPQLEMLAAVDFIVRHCDRYSIDPSQVGVIGFSAGGHLAATYAYKYLEIANLIGIEDAAHLRPKALCLCYPVITLVKNTHSGTKENITGSNPLLCEELSAELHVGEDYPPTFIWTTAEDNDVDPISTVSMDKALTDAGVFHRTIIYPHGNHGLALATELTSLDGKVYPDVAGWVDEFDRFFKEAE